MNGFGGVDRGEGDRTHCQIPTGQATQLVVWHGWIAKKLLAASTHLLCHVCHAALVATCLPTSLSGPDIAER